MMGSFVADLWSSIFTPGPTPTLLVATNTTFAALQVLLFALLLFTYSVHFLILSFLSGALWWAINWFAGEVMAAQRAEQEKKSARSPVHTGDTKRMQAPDSTADSETETESLVRDTKAALRLSAPWADSSAVHESRPGSTRKRSSATGDSSGYGSTDSEWEKVDDDNNTAGREA